MECEFSNIQQGHVSSEMLHRDDFILNRYLSFDARDLARNHTWNENELRRLKTID